MNTIAGNKDWFTGPVVFIVAAVQRQWQQNHCQRHQYLAKNILSHNYKFLIVNY
jgi:hypothetical protein